MASNLRTYFGCLTAALAYLHDQNIRHKDIKPQNILIYKANILFADFGLSRDFADDVGSTTSGLTPASPRYSVPEVAAYEARNTSSDIRSLGCVFVEMIAALHGLNVDWIKAFFAKHGSRSLHFHDNPAATADFIQALKNTVHPTDSPSLIWTEKMLSLERNARPKAARVLEMITSLQNDDTSSTANMFCGICCVPDFESDSMDSLADDFDGITSLGQPDPDNHANLHTQTQTSGLSHITKDKFKAASDGETVSPPNGAIGASPRTNISAFVAEPEAARTETGDIHAVSDGEVLPRMEHHQIHPREKWMHAADQQALEQMANPSINAQSRAPTPQRDKNPHLQQTSTAKPVNRAASIENGKQAATDSWRLAVTKQLRKRGYTDRDFEVCNKHLDSYIQQTDKVYYNHRIR
jgi:serine/threonine protein kinase